MKQAYKCPNCECGIVTRGLIEEIAIEVETPFGVTYEYQDAVFCRECGEFIRLLPREESHPSMTHEEYLEAQNPDPAQHLL